jgi:hypothetical protein
VKRTSRILVGGLGVIVGTIAIGESLLRRVVERQLREVVESRGQLERRFADIVSTQEQLKEGLAKERQRSAELSDALASTRTELEQTIGRLADERRTVRDLQGRLAAVEGQFDQVQGELAMTLQERPQGGRASGAAAVQLERIVVSDARNAEIQGRIVSTHKDWNFVVVNLGWEAVRIGDTVSIFRDDQLLARARVERVQEGACAVTLLPDWEQADVRVDDVVRIL